MKWQSYSWNEALTKYATDWERLLLGRNYNPSLHPSWIGAAAFSKNIAHTLRVIVGEENNTVTGLLPYYMSKTHMFGVPLNVVELASNIVGYHSELITSERALPLLETLLHHESGWDLFRACNAIPDSNLALACNEFAQSRKASLVTYDGESSPYLPIGCDWNDYLLTKKKRFRYEVRKRSEKLENLNGAQMKWYRMLGDVSNLIDAMTTVETRSWKHRDKVSIVDRPSEEQYYKLLLPELAARSMLYANVLYLAQAPIAYALCCYGNGWVGLLKTAFDEAYRALSAGAHVIDASVRNAFAVNAREYDFLGGADAYKLSWSTEIRTHRSYYLFGKTIRARAIGRLKCWKQAKMQMGS